MDRPGAVAAPAELLPDCGCAVEGSAGDWLRVGLGLVISGQLMLLSLALNLSTVEGDARIRISAALLGLTALGTGLLAPDLWRATRRAWARGDASLEGMFVLALTGGLGASLWGLWTGGDVFFEVVTVVLSVHALGARLKERFWSAAVARIGAGAWLPDHAAVVRDGALVDTPLRELRAGDRVAAFHGDRLPADGVVVEGAGWLDTSGLDGARLSVPVAVGDRVAGGSLVDRGHLRVDLLRAPDDGDHARAVAALLAATARELPSTGLVRRLARIFLPVVATIAVVSGLAWTWAEGPAAGFRVATAVLLVACPCGLGVATPVALWAAASSLTGAGVQVRRLGALEDLADLRTVALDKTGTLTAVQPDAHWTCVDPAFDLQRLRQWVGAVESWSSHPVAAALRVPAGRAIAVHDLADLPGGGVAARIVDGDRTAAVEILPISGRRGVEVRVDGRRAATVALTERLVDDAEALVDGLTDRGLRAEVLTGDRVGLPLQLPCRTAVAPADKATHIEELRLDGPVAFVGDAANDLAAMASADVSVAVRGASAGVAEQVDLTVQQASGLLAAVDVARATRRRLRLMLGGSFLGNLVGMGIAAAGLLHPVAAALIMAGTSLGVTLAATATGPAPLGGRDDR